MNKFLVSIINKFCLKHSMKKHSKTSESSLMAFDMYQLASKKKEDIEIKEDLI